MKEKEKTRGSLTISHFNTPFLSLSLFFSFLLVQISFAPFKKEKKKRRSWKVNSKNYYLMQNFRMGREKNKKWEKGGGRGGTKMKEWQRKGGFDLRFYQG